MSKDKNYWLVKSEPDEFSITDLKESPKKTACWDGVRNYQARNFMRDGFRKGDEVFFYHSNTKVPGVVGTCTVAREAYPDHTQFDPKDDHYDPKSKPEDPRWLMVDLKLQRIFPETVSLTDIKANQKLAQMKLVQKGSRLSVQPVTTAQWKEILKMAGI